MFCISGVTDTVRGAGATAALAVSGHYQAPSPNLKSAEYCKEGVDCSSVADRHTRHWVHTALDYRDRSLRDIQPEEDEKGQH